MPVDPSVAHTITAPSGVDGRGTIAVLNNRASANYVGELMEPAGFEAPEFREDTDLLPGEHGGYDGSFLMGRRPLLLPVLLEQGANIAALNANMDKLGLACLALSAFGTIEYTPNGMAARLIYFKTQSLRMTEGIYNCGLVSAAHRIYSGGSEATQAAGTSLTISNSGNLDTPPRFTIASPSATCVLTNSTTGKVFTFTGLNGGGTVTVDMLNKSITQGGVRKDGAITWPTSEWWELAPGSNSVTCTNAATPFHRHGYLS